MTDKSAVPATRKFVLAGTLNSALWLCYHALSALEMLRCEDARLCLYCEESAHDGDCLVGNGLKAVEDATRLGQRSPFPQRKQKR